MRKRRSKAMKARTYSGTSIPQDNELFSSWEQGKTRHLTVYTEPVAKGRPRFTKNGHAYSPAKTVEYEKLIRETWGLAHKGLSVAYIQMELDFYVPIPKGFSKSDKEKAITGEIRPDKKGDIDNYIKAVMDALNEQAYFDDKQVVAVFSNKWYAEKGRVEINITEIGRNVNGNL